MNSFEEVLFPVFQGILQQDILEFMPYVFQMLSLLLEIRENSGSISEPYWALFPCLLAPPLWDRSGNVTPLIRLISAFIKQDSNHVVALGKLVRQRLNKYFHEYLMHISFFRVPFWVYSRK